MFKYSRAARERLWTEAARLARAGEPTADVLIEAARVGNAPSLSADTVGEGGILSEAVALHPEMFAVGDAEALAAAERTDRVPEAMSMLAGRAADDWRPGPLVGGVVFNFVVTLLASCAVIGGLLLFFVMFKEVVFEELDVMLPAFTEATPVILGFELIMLLTVGGTILAIQWLPDWLVRRFPWLGAMQTRVSPLGAVLRFGLLAVWCDRMDLFRRLGLGMEEAVELSARVAGHPVTERVSASVVGDMRAGASPATAMEAESFFPDALVWSVYAGQEIGTSDHVWGPAARVYEDEAQARARVVLAVARLALVLAVVLAVLIVFFAIVLPFCFIFNSIGG